jgi:hypothetical protein
VVCDAPTTREFFEDAFSKKNRRRGMSLPSSRISSFSYLRRNCRVGPSVKGGVISCRAYEKDLWMPVGPVVDRSDLRGIERRGLA